MNKSPKMHKCGCCNKMATWLYLPSSGGMNFFCDDCVPRGCTCNVISFADHTHPIRCLNVVASIILFIILSEANYTIKNTVFFFESD